MEQGLKNYTIVFSKSFAVPPAILFFLYYTSSLRLIYSPKKYLLGVYYLPDMVLDIRYT